MISPELLRRYPFFGFLNDSQRKAVAMIADEISCEKGTTLFKEGQAATALYLLMDGGVDLYFTPHTDSGMSPRAEILIGEINPGEPFGLSALIDPYQLTSTARAATACRIIEIQASPLRALCETDPQMAYGWMRQVAKATMERLTFTRIQLAAARV